jgi:hypothetical protein
MAIITGIPLVGRGRIDDYTFYQHDGVTIARSRHNEINPARPLSERQLRQTTRMGNLVRLWHAFPKGLQPYFECRRHGVTCFNMFVTYAMKKHPVYMCRQLAGDPGCVLTDVVVSQGSLPSIEVTHDGTAPVTNIWLGGLTIDDTTTVSQLAKAIADNNYDYQLGDRLRYYLAVQDRTSSGTPRVTIGCCELALTPTDHTPLHLAVGGSTGFAQRGGRLAAASDVVGGMAWVHLRHVVTGTLASTQSMVCNNELMDYYGSEEAFAAACESYRRS